MRKLARLRLILMVLCLVNIFCDISKAVTDTTNFGSSGKESLINLDSDKDSKTDEYSDAISIAMALDENYLYPTLVSMTSMLENKNKDSKYVYYIMHPGDFSEKSKKTLQSLSAKYSNCVINFIDMENKYKNVKQGHVTTPTYYRLSLPDLLPNVDKIIWMDGDTLIFKDLNEMFNVDMKNYYFKGFLDNAWRFGEDFGVETPNYICAGVMVVNLKELRKDDMVKKFSDFIEENNDKLKQHDQTVINIVCKDKVCKLDPKYCIFNRHATKKTAEKYICSLNPKTAYSKEEMVNAANDPTVIHFVHKPWKDQKAPLFNLWWDHAKKTECFEEIKEKYTIKDGIYTIESLLDSNKVLGVDLKNINRSSLNVKLIDKKINGNQLFKVTYIKDGYYEIKSLETDKLLNVSGAKKDDGTNVDEHSKNGTDSQKWFVFKKQNDGWSIVSKCNQKCVDVSKAKKEAGTNIQCWSFNGTDAQKFKFKKVS